MGVANMLCLTGDGVQAGDQPGAKPVFDLDSHVAARNRPHHARQRQVPVRPQADDAAAGLPRRRRQSVRAALRLPPASISARRSPPARSSCRRQYCFDVPMFRTFMQKARDLGLHREGASSCAASARSPRPRRPSGSAPTCRASTFPDAIIKRLEGAQDQKKEGKQLCIDIINEVKEIPGVSGIHVMAYRQEEYVAEIVDESGVLKGRRPWKREIRARRPDGRRPARPHTARRHYQKPRWTW